MGQADQPPTGRPGPGGGYHFCAPSLQAATPAYLLAAQDTPGAPAGALLQLSRWKGPLPDRQVLPAPPLTGPPSTGPPLPVQPGLHPLTGLQPEGRLGPSRGCPGGC